jgi:UDP-glucose 4-epimerase
MKMLITGGAGYIGTELLLLLSTRTDIERIYIYDNLCRENYNLFLHSNLKPGRIKFIKGDLLDSRSLDKVVKEVDVVYHLAGNFNRDEKVHHVQDMVNNWGTAELSYALEESNVKQVVYLSSTEVYGPSNEEVDTNFQPSPNNSLGNSILRAENHIERLSSKMTTHIIRLANVFGYGVCMNLDNEVNRLLFNTRFVGKISIQGNGRQINPYISVKRAVNFLSKLAGNQDLPSGYYNVLDYNKSILDIVDVLHKQNPELEMIYTNQHLELPNRMVKHDEKLRNFMGCSIVDFEAELHEMRWHLQAAGKLVHDEKAWCSI